MSRVASVFIHSPNRIGGIEWFARTLSETLADADHSSVLAFAGQPTPAVAEFLSVRGTTVVTDPELGSEGLRQLMAVHRLLGKFDPDILHLHFAPAASLLPALGKLHKSRVFLTFHASFAADEHPKRLTWWKHALLSMIQSPVEGIFCVSSFGQEFIRKLEIVPPAKLVLHYNAVSVPASTSLPAMRQRFRQKWGIRPTAPLVLYVGQMIEEKGVADLIDAVPRVLAEVPEAVFAFVGGGPALAEFRQRAELHGTGQSVIFTGFDADLWESGAFAACDVLCAPSRWQEAFGFTIAEAMSCGAPVVATRTGGIPEVVAEGETGLLCTPGSPSELAASITRLLRDRDLAISFGESARRRVETHFEIHSACRQLLQKYGIGVSVPAYADAHAAGTPS